VRFQGVSGEYRKMYLDAVHLLEDGHEDLTIPGREEGFQEEEEEENAAYEGETKKEAEEPPEHDYTRRGEERHGEEEEVDEVEDAAEWPDGSTGCGAGGLLLLLESVVGTEGIAIAE
jgi:hypothetical protein